MPVLVSDTSVLIDLERASLIEEIFRLPFEFVVPDLLYERELADALGDRLIALGLRVEALTSAELATATGLRRRLNVLSIPDAFAYAIAQSRRWTLLTGDGALRRLAIDEALELHGVLWLFDQLADGGHAPFESLHAGLKSVSDHPRCRLPALEIDKRLARFSGDAT